MIWFHLVWPPVLVALSSEVGNQSKTDFYPWHDGFGLTTWNKTSRTNQQKHFELRTLILPQRSGRRRQHQAQTQIKVFSCESQATVEQQPWSKTYLLEWLLHYSHTQAQWRSIVKYGDAFVAFCKKTFGKSPTISSSNENRSVKTQSDLTMSNHVQHKSP